MGKISRIQLRGISRTPSDRLTEDGGCAESLNVQLDNTELAPSFIPEDVTKKLGLPDDLQAEKVFVHKTANYENYIVVAATHVSAVMATASPGSGRPFLELQANEKCYDIRAVGNTLIIATSINLYYYLFENDNYTFLGNAVHFPKIKCWSQISVDKGTRDFERGEEGFWFDILPSEAVWNALYQGDDVKDTFLQQEKEIKDFHTQMWKRIDQYINAKHIVGQAVMRYAVELYDNSLLSSLPLIIGGSVANPLEVKLKVVTEFNSLNTSSDYRTESNKISVTWSTFVAYAKLESDLQELLKWKDVIRRLKIYVSLPTGRSYNKEVSKMVNRTEKRTSTGQYTAQVEYAADLLLGSRTQAELPDQFVLENTSLTHLVADIDLSAATSYRAEGEPYSLQDLIDGCSLTKVFDLTDEDIAKGELLNFDDMQHYPKISKKLDLYNSALILSGNSQILSYDYNNLCSLIKEDSSVPKEYSATYYIKTPSGEKVVNSGPFAYTNETPYAFQFFPDTRAYRMVMHMKDITSGEIWHGDFEMQPHPFLACSYAYTRLGVAFDNNIDEPGELSILSNPLETIGNKLLISKSDNPFIFPIERRYTFDSSVLGTAIATTTLSQGQFGQFPLYVFTEDGIWAMEAAADGSFVTSKPLSRDVCVNTKSITSIDNAVVFVSAQGVMLLQGSQVTNISPYMNGKHYVVENTAQSIIEGQDFFCDLLPAISDKTHFLAFVKEASVAYDYAGKRLVFIKDDEAYQYVYKLDTQTWHKVAYGINMQAVINSYPECLVQGKGGVPVRKTMCHVVTNTNKDGREYLVNYIKEYFFIELTEEQINAFLDGEYDIDVTHCEDSMKEQFFIDMSERALDIAFEERIETVECTRIYDLSTLLDAQESMTPTRGIIATRPFDLGEPDILKTITDIRVRGQFPKGAVKFILLGSNDGVNFYTLSTLRGKSWKLFRMILLADLAPTDRISWVDVQYETKFTNRLR